MFKAMLFVHIIGALALGFYLVLPFIFAKVNKLSISAQEGTVSLISSLNRYAQIGLVIQLLTGGYMVGKGKFSIPWMIVVVVLFLIIGALSGMMGKPLRLALQNIKQKSNVQAHLGKLKMLSTGLSITVIVISFFMVYSKII
jgi:hypothetical protein